MEQSLFDIEEFLPEEERNDNEQKPVTCLGMEFESDNARREYFRAELRKKLPKLRGIEGFPIGEDDDIINLSDPPYYTACPNPWLNDFIAEWEKEKEQLKAEGKRTDNFEVKEPYASDVSEGKNNPVYVAHTYHTKVPHPAVMRYILHYTQPGDIVFDGFCGTGMTGVAAQACAHANDDWHKKIENEFETSYGHKPNWGERHAICGDLSPYATMIAYNYNTPVCVDLLKSEASRILKELEEECGWMYNTLHQGKPIGRINYMVWSDFLICPNCGAEIKYWNAALNRTDKCLNDSFNCTRCGTLLTKKIATKLKETYYDKVLNQSISVVKNEPAILVYSVGKKTFEKDADEYDKELVSKIDEVDCVDFFPLDRMPIGRETRRNDDAGITNVHLFYTKRNLITLAKLRSKIEQSKCPHKLRFIFTGMLSRSSKMNRMHVNHYFNGGGGWNGGNLKGTLYIPNLPVETSVLEQIEDKVNLLAACANLLPKHFSNLVHVTSANHSNLADNSVDYIFTDPPFGANITYSELNTLPEYWYKLLTNNSVEAIENTAQGKDKLFYFNAMKNCFDEYYRILKPGKWITVEFSNTSASIWNFIQKAIADAGFIIVNVAALDKKQGSFMAVTTTTAVKQDLVITCFKPTTKLTEKFERSGDTAENVWDFVAELLQHLPVHIARENKTTAIVERSPKILFDRVIAYYVQHGYPVPMDAQEFQQGLRERFVARDGMYFNAEQAIEYDEKKRLTPEFAELSLFVDSEANGINWLKHTLEQKPMTYADISPLWMQALADGKKGDKMPELMDILKENFIEEEGGYWRIPNPEKEADLEKIRTKKLLREFEHYVEHANLPKSKKLKDARLEALRTGFKQCYKDKEFEKIVKVGEKIPEALLTEDEVLLQYYDIATSRV